MQYACLSAVSCPYARVPSPVRHRAISSLVVSLTPLSSSYSHTTLVSLFFLAFLIVSSSQRHILSLLADMMIIGSGRNPRQSIQVHPLLRQDSAATGQSHSRPRGIATAATSWAGPSLTLLRCHPCQLARGRRRTSSFCRYSLGLKTPPYSFFFFSHQSSQLQRVLNKHVGKGKMKNE